MIGVFDSGIGGLTILSALRATMSRADFIYFGDTAHAPYGPRPHYELVHLTVAAMNRLQRMRATSFVSACNSVSVTMALEEIGTFPFESSRIIEMVGPAVDALAPSPGRVLLAATEATVLSRIYQDTGAMKGIDLRAVAIPGLAGALERGAVPAELEPMIREALSPFAGAYDTLLLGCTHYPLAMDAFRCVAGSAVHIVDPAASVAARAAVQFADEASGDGSMRFLISADSPIFRKLVSDMFPAGNHAIEVIE